MAVDWMLVGESLLVTVSGADGDIASIEISLKRSLFFVFIAKPIF